MRHMICAVAAACFLMIASAAHADTTYDFTLNETSGTLGSGMGSFEINTAPSGTQSIYISTNPSGDILEALTFTIDGYTFDLDDATSDYGLVEFEESGGVQTLIGITYTGTESVSSGGATLDLSLNAGDLSYTFSDQSTGAYSKGTITDVGIAPAAAPEPSSLALLGTGLVGAYAMLRRRRLV